MLPRRHRSGSVTLAVLSGLMLGALFVSAGRLWQARTALGNATGIISECLNLARQIAKHRQHAASLSETPASDATVTTQVNQAVQAAQIPSAGVVAIDPQPAQAIGDSDLRRQTVIIDLANLTMPQVVRFLDAVQQVDPAWVPSHLSFSAGGNRESQPTTAETWSVQVTLTRLSYSPITRDTP